MSAEEVKRREAWLKLFWSDLEQGRVRPREAYHDLFPELASEIDSRIDDHLAECELSSGTTMNVGRLAVMSPALHGQTLGHYRLIEEIGHGGQGFVYLAEDQRIHRKVALKILASHLLLSLSARQRFESEAEAAGRLDHPGIARVFDMGEDEGLLYIAMELVKGKTLSRVIRENSEQGGSDEAQTEFHLDFAEGDSAPTTKESREPRSWRPPPAVSAGRDTIMSAVSYIEGAARALHVAHEAGLIHRDVKPGNLMVREDGSACVLDFGLALDASSLGEEFFLEAKEEDIVDLVGTPAYMSPEQFLTRGVRLDCRTDVYSLGVCLFEACTLQRPFKGRMTSDPYDLIAKQEAPAPRRINPRIPRDLEAIILTAMARDRNRRYPSALALAEDLRRLRSFEPIAARPSGPLLRAQLWIQRNPIIATSATIVFATLLVSAVVLYVMGEEARRARDLAQEQARRTDIALGRERKAVSDYDRLADVKRLEAAVAAADLLYPPGPELVPELLAWQDLHGSLATRLEGHRAFLLELRSKALPDPDADRGRESSIEPHAIGRAELLDADLDERVATARDRADREKLMSQEDASQDRLGVGHALPERNRRRWSFAEPKLQFQHDILAELVVVLESFAGSDSGPVRSIARRLEQSRMIERKTVLEVSKSWRACRERIARHESYTGLDLEPQLGLIPLGPDPDSGLEEFLHWLTHEGPTPERDRESGKIAVTAELGLVFVLIPGGTFHLGSQGLDPSRPNYDPGSQTDEQPVREVALEPYFLSKYEMTQAQWWRAYQLSPSRYGPGEVGDEMPLDLAIDSCHPVERVSWTDAQGLLPRMDLVLPTEAEWERAARSGNHDQIYAGTSAIEELDSFANINGTETEVAGFPNPQLGHVDDHVIHARVGSFKANAFGLHDMSGNVFEWCLDGSMDRHGMTPGSRGLRDDPSSSPTRVARGGGFFTPALFARVAFRFNAAPRNHHAHLGVRPARLVRD